MKKTVKQIKLPITLLSYVLLGIFTSCISNKSIATHEPSTESHPKIIFLNYSIKKDSNNSRNIEFIDKKITEGTLKNINSEVLGVNGDLVFLQLDKKSKPLEHLIIKNPLSKSMEYLDESKSFQRKQINLDSIQFSIRLQLNPETKYISINDVNALENQSKSLIKTKIY
ncbi:hypothetical protein APS56_06530 [Pseudalgibacter alginicilyticus]|uniref:Lipoprotein n=1 Tax=Pseudalgibacter alginicilyticus TaxID=1736674 RepID=A0A0P0CPL2_9FLAO|nr:hypothetical protein [Pseudalgibacter alginicilyticus]ALJ04797.1 hypothetical protein APS56_06530 [Pseudalgibacter alginicilyticus]